MIPEEKKISNGGEGKNGLPTGFSGKVSIVPPEYSHKTIMLNAFRAFAIGIFLMCVAGIFVYMWQHHMIKKKEREHEAALIKNDIDFEMAFSKASSEYDERIRRLQKRIEDLGNENIVLRKQRDEARNNLSLIIEKKNWTIRELRSIADKMKRLEYEREQTLSLLGALENRYAYDDEKYKEELAAQYRREFLREKFPDFENIIEQ
jgi:hypothetical protein